MNQTRSFTSKSAVRPEQLADKLRFGDVQWAENGEVLIWHECRSDRGVLVAARPFQLGARDLNREYAVRAGVGYGGGDFSVHGKQVLFVSGPRILRQSLDETEPVVLYESDGDIASPVLSPSGEWMVFVESWKDRERLAMAGLEGGSAVDFYTSSDFNMQPNWHPSGKFLTWVSWEHPYMPWERSRIRIAEVSGGKRVRELSSPEAEYDFAAFQPVFSPDGNCLACVTDRGGWANLRIYSFPGMVLLHEMKEPCEHSQPAWIQGMRTFAWTPDSQAVYLIRNCSGISALARYNLGESSLTLVGGEVEKISSLAQISVSPAGQIALTGSSPSVPPRVLVTNDSGTVKAARKSLPGEFPYDSKYNPVPVSWKPGKQASSDADHACHGLLYKAEAEETSAEGEVKLKPPPAVIRIHGGPTSSYAAEFDPDVRFYTSRGFSVLALNYRGSSGYGREYRNLLTGNWGVTDVEDVKDAADFLVSGNLADRYRIFLDGGSAGGFTLLLSLIRNPGFFRGGICRYGVADLLKLTEDTHRFEAHYLDSLIGKLPRTGTGM